MEFMQLLQPFFLLGRGTFYFSGSYMILLVQIVLFSCLKESIFCMSSQEVRSDNIVLVRRLNALFPIGIALYPRMWNISWRKIEPNYSEITEAMRVLPNYRFVVMALLDCCGTFFAAMGAVHTPGQYQTLLNQTLIPFTMAASVIFLRSKFSMIQCLGAATILLGAFIVISPTLFSITSENSGLYLGSSLPLLFIFFTSRLS